MLGERVVTLYAFAIIARLASREASDVLAAVPMVAAMLPPSDSTALGVTMEMAALATTLDGDLDAALAMLEPYVEGRCPSPARIGARVRASASWLNIRYQALGELPDASTIGGQLQQLVREADLPISRAWAHNTFGVIALQRLDLDVALREFQGVLDRRTPPTVTLWTQGLRGLALCHHLAGSWDEALDFAEQAVRLAENATSPMLLEGARSFQARIRIDQGDIDPAVARARQAPVFIEQELPIYIESMVLTRARALFASEDAGHRRLAWTVLRQHLERVRRWRLMPAETFARATEAVMLAAKGRIVEAAVAIEGPVRQAERHGLLLPIVEHGEPRRCFLERLPAAEVATRTAWRLVMFT